MYFIGLLIFSALAVSAVAGYFSIVGLMTIFPAAATAILAMGIVLEIAKLVTASWIYQYWDKASLLLKVYFIPAVLVLSLITSIGIFGFLSRAHIDQTAVGTNKDLNIQVIEFRLNAETSKLTNAQNRIAGLDDTLKTSQGKDKNYVNKTQREEREELNSNIDDAIAKINTLNLELLPLRKEIATMDAELGPIKYIAELFFTDSDKKSIDKAVRIIIILLIFVFDPLAILLVIAANMSLMYHRGEHIGFTTLQDDVVEDTGFKYPDPPEPVEEDWVSLKYGKAKVKEIVETKNFSWMNDKIRGKKEQ